MVSQDMSYVSEKDSEVDDASMRDESQALSFGREVPTGMVPVQEQNYMMLQNIDDNVSIENAESYPTSETDWLSKGKEKVKSVDTNLSLSTWFGSEEVDTTLQLGSSRWSGLSQQQDHHGSGGRGGCKTNIRTTPSGKCGKCGKFQAKIEIAPTHILFKRSGHTSPLGVHTPTPKCAARLGVGETPNLEPSKIGRVDYWPRVQAPRTPHAQDAVNRAEEGALVVDNCVEHKLDVNLQYQVEQVIQNNVEIRPLTQVERLWFEQVRKEVRLQLGDGYRVRAAYVRQNRVARARIRPVCDDKSDVTTDAFMASAPAPNADDEETESSFKPDGGN